MTLIERLKFLIKHKILPKKPGYGAKQQRVPVQWSWGPEQSSLAATSPVADELPAPVGHASPGMDQPPCCQSSAHLRPVPALWKCRLHALSRQRPVCTDFSQRRAATLNMPLNSCLETRSYSTTSCEPSFKSSSAPAQQCCKGLRSLHETAVGGCKSHLIRAESQALNCSRCSVVHVGGMLFPRQSILPNLLKAKQV